LAPVNPTASVKMTKVHVEWVPTHVKVYRSTAGKARPKGQVSKISYNSCIGSTLRFKVQGNGKHWFKLLGQNLDGECILSNIISL
jgi:hypothetical protein